MQHENFNQDEWRVPEKVVETFNKDKNDRLCIFTGPIFTQFDRWYTRKSLNKAVRIPSGFWKVIAYIDKKTNKLECQAYIMYQDTEFLLDKKGQKKIEIGNYQVTITEIERLTGLEFPENLFDSNPLYYYTREDINDGPEGFKTPVVDFKKPDYKKILKKEGVVFSRKEAESKAFAHRKRELPAAAFEARVARIFDS